MARGKSPGGPWYGEFRRRLTFEHEARRVYADVGGRLGRHGGLEGFIYRLTVDVPTYERRKLTIVFPRRYPRSPRIFADGPIVNRHRFDDGSLCMWYWRDPPDLRWTFDQGLLDLVNHAILHLFKEAWFLDTGEWLGDEIIHDPKEDAA